MLKRGKKKKKGEEDEAEMLLFVLNAWSQQVFTLATPVRLVLTLHSSRISMQATDVIGRRRPVSSCIVC